MFILALGYNLFLIANQINCRFIEILSSIFRNIYLLEVSKTMIFYPFEKQILSILIFSVVFNTGNFSENLTIPNDLFMMVSRLQHDLK